MQADPLRTVTFKTPKTPARKSTRTTSKLDYANLNDGVESDPKRWSRYLETKPIHKHAFQTMKGQDVSLTWLTNDEKAMTEPIIIEQPDGLGMKMPEPSFSVSDVAKLVGPQEKIEVLGELYSLHLTTLFISFQLINVQTSHRSEMIEAGHSNPGQSTTIHLPNSEKKSATSSHWKYQRPN
jgi:hypothetical protein